MYLDQRLLFAEEQAFDAAAGTVTMSTNTIDLKQVGASGSNLLSNDIGGINPIYCLIEVTTSFAVSGAESLSSFGQFVVLNHYVEATPLAISTRVVGSSDLMSSVTAGGVSPFQAPWADGVQMAFPINPYSEPEARAEDVDRYGRFLTLGFVSYNIAAETRDITGSASAWLTTQLPHSRRLDTDYPAAQTT